MIKVSRIIIIPVVLLLFLVFPQSVHADGMIFANYGVMGEPGQEALIMKSGNTETLILRVKLQGDAKDLGWVIPLPSYPKVREEFKNLFEELERLTTPASDPRGSVYHKGLPVAVEVVEQITVETIKVGIYDVNLIKAEDETALFNWLNEHNFKQPESVKQLLDEYIQKKFSFVAVKIDLEKWDESQPDDPQNNPDLINPDTVHSSESIWLDPLRFDFKSDEWFYPMKISSQNTGATALILWTASDKIMTFPKSTVEWTGIVRESEIRPDYPFVATALKNKKFLTRLSWTVDNLQIDSDIILKKNKANYFGNQVYLLRFISLATIIALLICYVILRISRVQKKPVE